MVSSTDRRVVRLALMTACPLAALTVLLVAAFAPTGGDQDDDSENPVAVEPPSGPTPDGMVWIPGGDFWMGNDTAAPDESPRHRVTLDGFWMDAREVTNRQFQEFVDATDYQTTAEREPELRSIREGSGMEDIEIPAELKVPGSLCRNDAVRPEDIDPEKGAYSWWKYVPSASWRHPEGEDSSIDDRLDHPVVHVSWLDAMEYCKWAGKDLPTEAEWEFAARGGRKGKTYPWGNDRNPNGEWRNNIWQGSFPFENTGADGFEHTAPVGSFPANDFGLFDMSGNVWEWCSDFYRPDYYGDSPSRNPPGPADSLDPMEPHIIKHVQRGGSFMCSDTYCVGYRVSARMKGEEDTGAFHTGFRCVVRADAVDDYRAKRKSSRGG